MEAATAGNNSSNSFSGTDSNILSGEEIQAKGLSLYRGAQKLTKEEIRRLSIGREFAYDYYKGAKRKNVWAWVLMANGGCAVIAGIFVAVADETPSAAGTAIGCVIGGTGCIVGGVFLWKRARANMKSVAAIYNANGRIKPQATSYELSTVVPETGGLGLRLSF